MKMKTRDQIKQLVQGPERLSYAVMIALFAATIWLELAPLLVAALFSYLTLKMLQLGGRISKWLALALFLALVLGSLYALTRFIIHGLVAFPEIADKAIPSFIRWARTNEIELPFSDYETLRESGMSIVAGQLSHFGSYARAAQELGVRVLLIIVGCVAAISIYLNSQFELGRDPHVKPNNLYSLSGEHLKMRFRRFFQSFKTVMGAQILISAVI